MTTLGEITALPRGAKFYRVDLHIHSFGGSHDVRDTTMTPSAIVDAAVAQGLAMIAVTDHNEITNVSAALIAATGKPIVVVPGVELSTPQGHLLAYLPSLEALQRFHGRLNIVGRGTQDSRCQNALVDCLNLLQANSGFGVLAHVDVAAGFEVENSGASPHKLDVLCHCALLGIELKSASSVLSYSEGDPDQDRARMGEKRIERLRLGKRQYLARVLFSDSHTLNALGRNAAGDKKVTRVKMDKPSFDALRIALEDSDARVRIEDLVPAAVPHVLGVRLTGGFLDGQTIHLSPNLNCIVGGRGTGKSTTFEALGCLSAHPSESGVIDSEVWPGELNLWWRDAAGQDHSLQKLLGEPLTNLDDGERGPVAFPMDCYGQGETARLGVRTKTDPLALLAFLDRFMELDDAKAVENTARDQLLELQTKIEEAELKVALIPQYERSLETTQQQLKASEKAKAAEVIQLQRRLAGERAIRDRIREKWQEAQSLITSNDLNEKLDELQAIAESTDVAVGANELRAVLSAVATLASGIKGMDAPRHRHAQEFNEAVSAQLRAWKAKDDDAKRTIETKRQDLEAQGVRLDMAFIQKLATDEANYKKSLDSLRTWKPHLATLRKRRASVLEERWSARNRVAAIRIGYAAQASETMKESLSDLQVSLKFIVDGSAPDAAEQIQQALAWRTNQVPRAKLLVETLTLPKLLDAIEKNDANALTALAYEDGTHPFDRQDANEILTRLAEPKVKFALERCAVHDHPRLLVTKKIERDGKPHFITREFSKLSLGQQQSILLTLLLSSDGNDPLIIDQPEDNLDGEFIYSSFVPVLRRAKERRQIVIVTHNANIAVLGDAEQLVVLKSHNDKGVITTRGSIDDPDTRKAACAILEGAEEAFLRRAKIYGLPS